MTTIIVGIGNPILGDDGVGIHAARKLKEVLKDRDIVIEEAYTGGMNLLDIIVGYDRAVLVDAVSVDDLGIGEVIVLEDAGAMSSAHSANPHDVSFPEALEVARKMGEKRIPEEIVLVGINIRTSLDFNDELSVEVEESVSVALEVIKEMLEELNE
ncbi:MAG: hydrogenase maturation protease [Thermoplasmatota archaeon]